MEGSDCRAGKSGPHKVIRSKQRFMDELARIRKAVDDATRNGMGAKNQKDLDEVMLEFGGATSCINLRIALIRAEENQA